MFCIQIIIMASPRSPPFFEGWYFKLVSADERHRFAIIPGVYLGRDVGSSHSFVPVFNSNTNKATFRHYPLEDFKASPDVFKVMIGPNYFSSSHVKLTIDDGLAQVNGVEFPYEKYTDS